MTITSLDGLRYDAIDSSGVVQSSLIYLSDEYEEAQLKGDGIFDIQKLKDDNWVTIFKYQEIEKLIVSIKLVAKNVFSIKSFYGRTSYYLKQSEKPAHFILTNEKKLTLIEIVLLNKSQSRANIFEINAVAILNIEREWFFILLAVHCALHLVRLSDELYIESFRP